MPAAHSFLLAHGHWPLPHDHAQVGHQRARWLELAATQTDPLLAEWMRSALDQPPFTELMPAIFGNSPYLSQLLLNEPALMRSLATDGLDESMRQLMRYLHDHAQLSEETGTLMEHLRRCKGKLALLAAVADISGMWPVEQVTAALSDFAEACLSIAIDHLLKLAAKRGEITLPQPEAPSRGCGIIVLAMGKLGGRELNYSSDIDLIIFFESGVLNYQGRHTEQHFMNKLAQELVQIMQERTAAGYVFRTDLRLRPDPASTPPAMNTEAAYYYYEGVGQNWERAAMIKARPIAGDREAGAKFLGLLRPFMWRRSLDFAALNDIHSIKRQMDTLHSKTIELEGHNIKLGLGGIREIEFYVQIHQLIWGGRQPALRVRATCEALDVLVEHGLVEPAKRDVLKQAYRFLRTLEHRLQMVADEQTHSLPHDADEILRISRFMGFAEHSAFAYELFKHLYAVHTIFSGSFRSAEKLGDEGNLVFTGVSHDPETLETIRTLGYANPETISEIIMGWHHGSRRATRTKRARELLTELMPLLLKRLGETANPDAAFLKFNDFLSNLPAGAQLFSLFAANPDLLGLIADIMGSAPLLAELLSKSPSLMDAVLYADFYAELPDAKTLASQLGAQLHDAQDFEATLEALCQFKNEKHFQAGVQLLRGMINARQAGLFLADLADLLIRTACQLVQEEFTRSYGEIQSGRFAVMALGKLGSQEMTFSSDIDLVFVYDAPDADSFSSGEKSFSAGVYYNRLAQRLLNSITLMGKHGRLYEVDTRLRPSGSQGPLASSLQAFGQYFEESAWTFEFMALCKARVICAQDGLDEALERCVHRQLSRPRELQKLRHDAADMRQRIAREFGTGNPWDLKYARGGIIDVDFMAQVLLLSCTPLPEPRPRAARDIFAMLAERGILATALAQELITDNDFLVQILGLLRLSSQKAQDAASLPHGIKKLLCHALQAADFDTVEKRLREVEARVLAHYIALVETHSHPE